MLWIGERLSTLERLSVASFLANGHPVHLYGYAPIGNVPPGTEIADAGEIVPRSEVFTHAAGFGAGSFATFSDLFRFKLLLDRGGIWCDADIVCLRPLEFSSRLELAVASERLPPNAGARPGALQMNGCFLKASPGTPAIRECYDACVAADKALMKWGDIGPTLITRTFLRLGLQSRVLKPDVICPVDWWNADALAREPFAPPADCHAIHFFNEIWRQKGLDKDGTYEPASAYEALKRRYL